MSGIRRFGLKGTTRYRIYMVVSFMLFLGLILLGDDRWFAIAGIIGLMIWIALFDSIGPDGERRILGLRSDSSFFGKQTRVGPKRDD